MIYLKSLYYQNIFFSLTLWYISSQKGLIHHIWLLASEGPELFWTTPYWTASTISVSSWTNKIGLTHPKYCNNIEIVFKVTLGIYVVKFAWSVESGGIYRTTRTLPASGSVIHFLPVRPQAVSHRPTYIYSSPVFYIPVNKILAPWIYYGLNVKLYSQEIWIKQVNLFEYSTLENLT